MSVIIDQASATIANDHIKVAPSTAKPGILDLYWKPNPWVNEWDIYNNLVVIAWRKGIPGNSEIQKAAPTMTNVQQLAGGRIARVTYAYPPFSNTANVTGEQCNDAEMRLVIEISDGPFVRTALFSANDVDRAAINNYWGLKHELHHLDTGAGVKQSTDAECVDGLNDGYFVRGKFTELPASGSAVSFWGDDNGPIQWQAAPADRATLIVEVRRTPWDQSQGAARQTPWFETVSLERNPFKQGDETWFGFTRP